MTRAALLFLEMRAAPIELLWDIIENCLAGEKPTTSLRAA